MDQTNDKSQPREESKIVRHRFCDELEIAFSQSLLRKRLSHSVKFAQWRLLESHVTSAPQHAVIEPAALVNEIVVECQWEVFTIKKGDFI
jgi:hypothetical protein